MISSLHATETISFQIGGDYFIKENVNYKIFKVNNFGQAYGINIPIQFSSFQTNVKAKFAYHNLERSDLYNEDFFYASMLNEFLFGKNYEYSKSVSFLPQFGLGLKNELIGKSTSSGIENLVSRYYLFYDVSILNTYTLKNFNLGILLNFEKGFFFNIDTNNKINFSIVIII